MIMRLYDVIYCDFVNSSFSHAKSKVKKKKEKKKNTQHITSGFFINVKRVQLRKRRLQINNV